MLPDPAFQAYWGQEGFLPDVGSQPPPLAPGSLSRPSSCWPCAVPFSNTSPQPQAQFSCFNLPCNPIRPFPEHTLHFPNCQSLERGAVGAGRPPHLPALEHPPPHPGHTGCTLLPPPPRPLGGPRELWLLQPPPSGRRSPGLSRTDSSPPVFPPPQRLCPCFSLCLEHPHLL